MLEIDLPPETEARLRQRAVAKGKDVAAYLLELLEEELQDDAPLRPDQRLAEFRAWVKSHTALPYEADDSRGSIYEDDR